MNGFTSEVKLGSLTTTQESQNNDHHICSAKSQFCGWKQKIVIITNHLCLYNSKTCCFVNVL